MKRLRKITMMRSNEDEEANEVWKRNIEESNKMVEK